MAKKKTIGKKTKRVARAAYGEEKTASEFLKRGPVHYPRRDDLEPIWARDIDPDKTVKAIETAVEDGQPSDLIDIFDRCRRQDLVLRGIIATRIKALLACDWEIVADPDSVGTDKEPDAKAAQDFVTQQMQEAEGVDAMLAHIAEGVLYGVTVTEAVWEPSLSGHRVREFCPVPHKSLFGNTRDPWRLVIPTKEYDHVGTPLTEWPNKFIVHCPEKIGNSPWGAGLFVAAALRAVLKHYCLKWMAGFTEKYGAPYVWATYDPASKEADTRKLANALSTFGYDGYGMGPAGWTIEFIESLRSGDSLPQSAMMDRIDKEFAIGILGQQLTTQTSDTGGGGFSLGKVHEQVRQDIIASDAVNEAITLRQYVFKPMLELGGMRDAPIPYFQRKMPEAIDREAEGRVLDIAVNTLGLKVTNATAYDSLQIPIPDGVEADDFVEGGVSSNPFGSPFDQFALKALKKKR